MSQRMTWRIKHFSRDAIFRKGHPIVVEHATDFDVWEAGVNEVICTPNHCFAIRGSAKRPGWLAVFHPGLIAAMNSDRRAGKLLDGIQRSDVIPVTVRDQDQGNFLGV